MAWSPRSFDPNASAKHSAQCFSISRYADRLTQVSSGIYTGLRPANYEQAGEASYE